MPATKSLAAELFRPSTSVKGDELPTIIRGENILLRGPRGNQYFEVHPGDKDLGENYNIATLGPVTASAGISTTAGSFTVSATGGSGTAFKDELHPGQLILATNGEVFAVKEVISQTSFTAHNAALATTSGLAAYRLPQMFEIDRKRGVMLTGNALEFRLGHKVAVGSGDLYINGTALNATLTATRTPKAAIYRPAQDDYVIRNLGFTGIPPAPVINIVTGGTKGMIPTNLHSFRLSYWAGTPEGTNGFSRATDAIKTDGSGNPIKIVLATDQFEIDVTTSLVGMPTNAKGFVVWKSQEGKAVKAIQGATVTTSSPNDTLYNNGPWLRAAKFLVASQTFVDADVNTGTERITLTNHPFETGDKVFVSNSGGAVPVFVSVLATDTPAYVIKIDANTISLATSLAESLAGTANGITSAAGGGTHTIGYLITGDKFRFDCLDEELLEEYFGDDYAPSDAEFVAKLEDRPLLISCFGKRTVTSSKTGSNPGPLVSLSKFSNPDGFPPEWTAGGQHNIIGHFEGAGRIFLMTPASLDFVTPTGLLGQSARGGLDIELPMIWRPYWKTGATNRYSIVLDDDTLYGRSGGKFIRSIGNGDENVRKYDFGAVVEDITRDWNDAFTYTVRNPRDGQVCFIRSAAYKNSSGYWVSEIWPFSVWADAWLPKVVLSSTTRDQIICGVATIDEQLEYLVGGRVSGGTYQVETKRFGAGAASGNVNWYFVWQPSDDGAEDRMKRLHSLRLLGKVTTCNVQIHGARPGQELSLANIENGDGANTNAYYSGNIGLDDSDQLTRYLEQNVKISKLANYAVRIGGRWSTSDTVRDRVDELVISVSVHGRPR